MFPGSQSLASAFPLLVNQQQKSWRVVVVFIVSPVIGSNNRGLDTAELNLLLYAILLSSACTCFFIHSPIHTFMMESTSVSSMEMEHDHAANNNRGAEQLGSRHDGDVVVSNERRHSVGMSPQEEKERRASIREIMQDPDLTPLERRQSIQSLMDGRRRSSIGGDTRHGAAPMSMVAAAAVAAAEFYDSSDDEMMNDDDDDHPAAVTQNSESTASSSSTLPSQAPHFPPPPLLHHGRSRSTGLMVCYATTAASTADEGSSNDGPNDSVNVSKRLEQSRPPCNHYDRKCSIVSPCCGLAFGCRICHDECPILPAPIHASKEEAIAKEGQAMKRRRSLPATLEPDLSHHSIDRFAVQQVICRECFTRQDSKT